MNWTLGILILPFLGATAGLVFWSRPRVVQGVALLAAAATLIGLASGAAQGDDPATTVLMLVIALAALLAVLGQQRTGQASLSLVVTLVFLGLSLGGLSIGRPVTLMVLGGLMGTLALLLSWRAMRQSDSLVWGAVAWLGIGILAQAASVVLSGGTAAVMQLIVCAVLLPLFPFHAAFVGSLSSLPGTLPAFLVVLLPGLGWHGLAPILAEVPAPIAGAVAPLALCGALYVALRASVQVHLSRTLASVTVVLIALIWWHVSATGKASPEAGWYLYLVTLASSGLLLAAHQLDARYGALSLDKLQGLARPMPRFATLVGLLLMAAMGLPIFGVFSGFLAMMAAAPLPLEKSMMVVLLIWLAVSVLLVALLQRLLFRQASPDLIHRDLAPSEMVALVLIIGILAVAGMVPADVLWHDQGGATVVTIQKEGRP